MQLPGEFSPFIEKSGYPLSGPTTKKKPLFLCVSSLRDLKKKFSGIFFSS